MPQPLSFRWDPEFVARLDAARGKVKRSAFVRAAVEVAMSDPAAVAAGVGLQDGGRVTRSPSGSSVQGRQPKVSHPKPAMVPVARASVSGLDRFAQAAARNAAKAKKGGKS